ncbi:MAG: nucleotidyltransferase family protein [Candidatus Bathyarchaeia archaeon]
MPWSREYYISALSNKLLYTFFARVQKEHIIEIAKVNKVLYQLGNLFPEVQKSGEWLEVSKRRNVQIKELIRFNEAANDVGLKYIVVKTFRFPEYVPDDIDILVHPDSRHLIWDLISILVERNGYFLRNKGTTEVTVRKNMHETYVDLDLHADLGAGPYVYLDAQVVFENSTSIRLRGETIPTVNQKFEFIICAAHAVMKEFELTLADVLTFLYICSSIKMAEVLKTAEDVGLTNATCAFWRLSQFLIERTLLRENIIPPYRIPLHFTLLAYVENIVYRMKFGYLKPFKELFSFPSSKGIKKLVAYK